MALPIVYFICTGNSARSQMAEGFARHLGGDRLVVASAGIAPSRVNPLAIAVMDEAGVDIRSQYSKAIDLELLDRASVVVTLCGDAEESCPVTPPHVRRIHWPLTDPSRVEGDETARRAVFRTVRDQIAERVAALIDEMVEPRDRHPVAGGPA